MNGRAHGLGTFDVRQAIARTRDAGIRNVEEQAGAVTALLVAHEGDDVAVFIERCLRWNTDSRGHQWLWMMFGVDSPLTFLGELHSFVANCLLDDSRYEIVWRITSLDGQGGLRHRRSTKDNPRSRPWVRWTTEGLHDARPLLEAMDLLEAREIERDIILNAEMEADE